MTTLLAPTGVSDPVDDDHARRRVDGGPSSNRTRRRIGVVLSVLLVGLAQLVNVTGWPVFGDDEGTYTAQAWAVLHGDLAHYTYWYDHPPAGWIQLAAGSGCRSCSASASPSPRLGWCWLATRSSRRT